jgi:hypothetical protein
MFNYINAHLYKYKIIISCPKAPIQILLIMKVSPLKHTKQRLDRRYEVSGIYIITCRPLFTIQKLLESLEYENI